MHCKLTVCLIYPGVTTFIWACWNTTVWPCIGDFCLWQWTFRFHALTKLTAAVILVATSCRCQNWLWFITKRS